MKVRHREIEEFGTGKAVRFFPRRHEDGKTYDYAVVEWRDYARVHVVSSLVFIVPAPSREYQHPVVRAFIDDSIRRQFARPMPPIEEVLETIALARAMTAEPYEGPSEGAFDRVVKVVGYLGPCAEVTEGDRNLDLTKFDLRIVE